MAHLLCKREEFKQRMCLDSEGKEIIVVKDSNTIHAYRNSCPHIGIGLDYGDGNCLYDDDLLVCSLHGALFEVSTGHCVAGPCSGQYLQRIPIDIRDDGIYLI